MKRFFKWFSVKIESEAGSNKVSSLSPFSLDGFTIVFISFFCLFPFVFFICSLIDSNVTIHTLTLSYFAFFLGKTLEFRKICGSWRTVILTMLGSFFFSLFNFLPYKKEGVYSLQNHLDNWPIVFSMVFLIVIVGFNSKKLTLKIGEGITLLHSLALLYYFFERFQSGLGSGWWVAACILPLCFSLTHALTYIEITKSDRLYLSIWSSITMIIFAFLYLLNVIQMENVEKLISENHVWKGACVFFEYFLLGASGAYIAQNAFMLFGYLPRRNHFFNLAYFNAVRELNKSHIDRYSSDQVDRKEASFVLILVGGFLASNSYFRIMPPTLAIWACFIIAPIIVGLFGKFF
jgi:hypothetical protein